MKTFAFVGSWKPKKEAKDSGLQHGFTTYSFNEETGAADLVFSTGEEYAWLSVGASWVDSVKGVLYCTHEDSNHPDCREGGGGLVLAFKINPETGALTEINRKPSYGCNPSMVVTDPEGKFLLATNYGFRTTITKTSKDAFGKFHIVTDHDESNVVLFPLAEDGSIGDPVDIYVISGEGPASFQISPHAHSITRSPDGNLYVVCDKGGDQVFTFKVDYDAKKLQVCYGPLVSEPGTAPRYCAFHPTLPYFVYNKENKTIMTAVKYSADGMMQPTQTVSTLPEELPDPKKLSQSDLTFGKDGKHLYACTRNVDVITVFEFSDDGKMELIQTQKVSATHPRGCRLSPDGRYLIVAAMLGNKVEIYPINEDGTLSDPVSVDSVTPGNISFYQV